MSSPSFWLKHQMIATDKAFRAREIWLEWRVHKKGTYNLILAIHLLDSLLRGDPSVLLKNFPGIAMAGLIVAPVRQPGLVNRAAPQVEVKGKPPDVELSEALEMFSGMEF